MRTIGLVLGLAGCGTDYGLTPVEVTEGAAVDAWESSGGGERREVFELGEGAVTPVADYLFVVDHSSSMHRVIDRVRRGLETLADEDAFPPRARLAVTSTLPGRFQGDGPHEAVSAKAPRVDLDPGFLRLVDAEGIARYRAAVVPEVAARFGLDGCGPWFSPGERNAAGVPCLLAHTQIGLGDVGVEAGLTALKQLVTRSPEPLFRPGAAVNVIFVSDTHDPGKEPHKRAERLQELIDHRPDLAELERLVLARQPVASFTVHAVAPRTECSEKWAEIGPVYFDAAEASGGKTLDVCTAEDYAPLLRDVATQGAIVRRPVFPLGRRAGEVAWVEVDGEPVGHRLLADGRVVELTTGDLAPGTRSEVVVHYRPRVDPPEGRRRVTRVRPDPRPPVGGGGGEVLVDPGLDPK